jgi:hypothetical protein
VIAETLREEIKNKLDWYGVGSSDEGISVNVDK